MAGPGVGAGSGAGTCAAAGWWCGSEPSPDPGRGTGPCLMAHASAVKAAHYGREENKYTDECELLKFRMLHRE